MSGTNQIDFSPDGSQLVGAGADGSAWLWEAATGQELAKLEGEEASLIQALFSPDGTRVAAVNWDGTGFVWDVATSERLATLNGHTDAIWSLVYSPDGDMIATASEDGTARLWDAESGEELFLLRGHDQPVLSIAFSPTSGQVATGGADGTLRLWNVQTGGLEAILPDAKGVQVLVNWDVAAARQASVISTDYPTDIHWVHDVNFSPSGDRVVAASLDGSVETYIADTGKLLEIAQSQVSRKLTCQERVQFLYEELDCPQEATATPSPTVTITPTP
jgi:WD40 repeat protein